MNKPNQPPQTAKAREFWLDIATPYGDPCDFIHDEDPYVRAKREGHHPCVSATNIHVIEHAPVMELIAKLESALQFYQNLVANDKGEGFSKAREALAELAKWRGDKELK